MRGWQRGGCIISLTVVGLWAQSARAEKDYFEVGEVVPVFTLKSVNADDAGVPYVGIDSYYGPTAKEPKKAILLSFFATYCEPCKREMPFLAALYDSYKDKGLVILSVSIDKENDKVEYIRSLAKTSQVKFPVLSDRFNIVAKRYMISRLPCVYLVNPEGKVAMVSVGYNDDITKQMFEEVRKLVGEPTSDPIPETLKKHLDSQTASAGHAPAGDAVKDDAAGDDSAADSKGKKKGKKTRGTGKKKR